MNRARRLKELRAVWNKCQACNLHKASSQVVHGGGYVGEEGDRPTVMFIGQAPGTTEDEHGMPFIGAAGELLMETLMHLFTEDEGVAQFIPTKKGEEIDFVSLREVLNQRVYFTNIVSCWPPGDREPATGEVKACRPRLHEEIRLVDPVLIIALGKVAQKHLTKDRGSIENARGKLHTVKVPGVATTIAYPVYVTYHPSHISRLGDFNSKGGKFETWYKDLSDALGLVDYHNHRLFGDDIPNRE